MGHFRNVRRVRKHSRHLIITGHGLFPLLDQSCAFPHSHERGGLVHFQMLSCQLSVEINAKIMETWGDVVYDGLVLGGFCTSSVIRSYHTWIILLSLTLFTLPHWLVDYTVQSAYLCRTVSSDAFFRQRLFSTFWPSLKTCGGKKINQTDQSELFLSPSGFYGIQAYLKMW